MEKRAVRRIAIMIGSLSDLPQCIKGLGYLRLLVSRGEVMVVEIIVNSIHRNTDDVIFNLKRLEQRVDVLIVGAGWANHLTGMVDAILRYKMRNDHIVVVGVAFDDENDRAHTQAACLSITEVPGHQVRFRGYVGTDGFLGACEFAAKGELPKIKLPEAKRVEYFQLDEAIAFYNNVIAKS